MKVRVLVEQMFHGRHIRDDFSSSCTRVVSGRKKYPGNKLPAGGAVVQRVERWTCEQILLKAMMHNNLEQVVHTYVPLSPSSITWYRPKGGDALRLGR